MSEVRAAFYLATKERLDRKRLTAGKLKCNPPNKQCGNRCIPPSWDCRLKGEGPDPHLRAVKTDPLKGLASIERGTKRLLKGVTKGSFSDLEGGKKAIIRGAVQIAPGDLQQKKRLQARLEARTRTIGLGLAVVTTGLGAHAILMRSNTHNYRYTVGAKINEATREGVNKILDATPLLGQQRARNRSAVEQLVAETAYRARTAELRGPGALQESLGRGGEASLSSVSFGKSADSLNTALRAVDERFTRGADRGLNSSNFLKWNKAHRKAFWSVDESTTTDGRNPNIFARPTAESFLTKQYNLTNDEAATRGTIETALIGRITEDKLSLTRLASQQGFRVKRTPAGSYVLDKDDVPAFVSKLTRTSFGSSPSAQALRSTVEKQLIDTLTKPANVVASSTYKDTVKGFDEYYSSVAKTMSNINRVPTISAVENRMGYSDIIHSADRSRANYLAGVMGLQRKVSGDAHAELINLSYYSTRVAGKSDSKYYVSERLARTAASEIAGRPVNTNEEAYRLLTTQYGFTGASRTPIRVPKPPKSQTKSGDNTELPKPQTPRRRRTKEASEEDYYEYAQWRSRSERIKDILARKGNEKMSKEAAENLAEAEEEAYYAGVDAQRSNMDTAELIRTATYLATRNDLQKTTAKGKPCGASHIPKAHECRKGQNSATPPASPQRSESPEPVRSNLGKKIALAAVAGAIGAVAVTVALDARRYYNSKDLPNPPSYKAAIRSAKASDPKMPYDVAIGKYYDNVAEKEGWKPGTLVYTRFASTSSSKDPTAHFAVYMGKNGDSHQFADFGIDLKNPRQGQVDLYGYGPGNKGAAPFIFAKAPALKGESKPYNPEDIQQRVFLSIGGRLKYDALDNNCETWARMITSGTPRSTQVERLSALTRSLYRRYDRLASGASPTNIPSVKQQARILDYQSRMMSGDASAIDELDKFQSLIAQGKRTDSLEQQLSDMPSPKQLLSDSTSDLDALIRTKLYLMLLIRTLGALPANATP